MGMHVTLAHVYTCKHPTLWVWVCTHGILQAINYQKSHFWCEMGAKGVRKGCERGAKGAKGAFRTPFTNFSRARKKWALIRFSPKLSGFHATV
jgi:hypothetical protein